MDIIRRIYLTVCVAAVAMVGWSCSGDEPAMPGVQEPAESRTVLVYMVADNNLSGWAGQDLSEMQTAAAQGLAKGQRWLVYYSGRDHKPRLLEYLSGGEVKELAAYDDATLSVTIDRMQRVVADAKRLAPADNYGLVLWSHGTGWLNDGAPVEEPSVAEAAGGSGLLAPQSFGVDGTDGARMKVTSLARALSGHHFEFIYFDCCHMANVEVIYELRDVADRIVACPTELGVEGMPYQTNVALLLAGKVEEAAAATFDFYNNQYYHSDGYGCAIGVYSTAAIADMANALAQIHKASAAAPADYSRVRYFRSVVMRSGIYDLSNYVDALKPSGTLRKAYDDAASRLVEYFATTPDVYLLDASHFTGVAGNIVETQADVLTYDYDELSWYSLVWE